MTTVILRTDREKRPQAPVEYAKNVARVGALAFALGVGGAFASAPGLAWADESAPAPSDSASTSDPPADPPVDPASDPPVGAPAPSPEPAQGSSADHVQQPDDATSEPSSGSTAHSVTVADGVTISSSGGAQTSGTEEEEDEAEDEEEDDEDLVESGADQTVAESEDSAETEDSSDNDMPLSTPGTQHTLVPNDPPDETINQPLANDQADDSADLSAIDSGTSGTSTLFATVSMNAAETTVPVATSKLALPSPTTALRDLRTQLTLCICHAVRQTIEVVVTAVSSLFGSFAGAAAPGGPATAPTGSPAEWGLVAWVRRQLDQILQSPPVAQFISDMRSLGEKLWYRLLTCGQDLSLEDGFERTTVVSGLSDPTDFRFTRDGKTILITEKSGAIRIVEDGVLRLQPLVVLPTLADLGERGLSGIELHPDFDGVNLNGYIYAAYTSLENRDVLSRLTVTNGQVTDVTEMVKSTLPTAQIHHGGEIRFGPDGMLYWSVGDNGHSRNAQDLTNIHGKVLRMDPITGKAPDPLLHAPNPTFDDPEALEQIYAYGLRNPFRFTFTPNGRMLLADVGEANWEEINIIEPGGNYGWPGAEGMCRTACADYIDPIYTYAHTPPPFQQGAITAALLFTGDAFGPNYENKVFIADYSLGWIKELTFTDDYSTFISERTFDGAAGTTVRLAQGPDGNLYQLTIFPGILSRIAVSDGNRAPTAVITAEPTNGPSPLEVAFSATGSTDPEGKPLTYAWDFGDGTSSTERNPVKTYESATVNTYTVTLTVSDGLKTGQATTLVTVGSTVPQITEIGTSATGGKYNAGQTIRLMATASDAEDDADELEYRWTVVFHHANHIHPYQNNILGKEADLFLSDDPHNVDTTFYEITLTVTDSSGLSKSESVTIHPNLVDLVFQASNPAATFTVDGILYTGSLRERGVVGVRRELDAPSTQVIDGQDLVFSGWSDGGAQLHTIITPGTDATYAVTYDTAAIATFDVQASAV